MASNTWKSAYRYGNVGLDLVLSIVVGFLLGRWVDRHFLEGHGYGTVIGTIIGVYAGFRQLYKISKQAQAEAEAQERRDQAKADKDAKVEAYKKEADALPEPEPAHGLGAPDEKKEEPKPRAVAVRCWLRCVAVPGAMAAALAFLVGGRHAGVSASAGAAIALVNVWALRSIIAVLADAAATGRRGGLGFFIVPKTLALFGIVWLLLARHFVSAGGLALGYAALPMGVAIGALVCNKAA